MTKIHRFSFAVGAGDLPSQFTYPFHYVPHHLAVEAAKAVEAHLERCKAAGRSGAAFVRELDKGKMLGVLVVRADDGTTGFLAAFSGQVGGRCGSRYFVPAIYDMLRCNGVFARGEREIKGIGEKISALENADELLRLTAERKAMAERFADEEESHAELMIARKRRRDEMRRADGHNADKEAALVAESQFLKAELRRMKGRHKQELELVDRRIAALTVEIDALRACRKELSLSLQTTLFSRFRVLNGKGERRSLLRIFADSRHELPPTGAGECAAPKLLHYAFAHHLRPVCMAEFWHGEPPSTEVRRHGCFYPSCRSKCLPVLTFMLQGVDVEPNPLEDRSERRLSVVYEGDGIVVVDKPAGMLSVKGKIEQDDVARCLEKEFNISGYAPVHRLDQATSGLLVLARKGSWLFTFMQQLFASRKVEKEYIAILDGVLKCDNCEVALPLRPNPDDRPRQMVDPLHGKKALTRVEVISRTAATTRVRLLPLTGRTHQLRVHCAHRDGLNMPIVGDTLYGTAASRLMLHCRQLSFIHPITKQPLSFTSEPDF